MPRPSPSREVMGPMIHSVRIKVTPQVMSGTKNSLQESGMNFLYFFSNHAANAMAQTMGRTREV